MSALSAGAAGETPRAPSPILRVALLPLERFDRRELRKDQPFDPSKVRPLMRHSMAGHPLSPTAEEFRQWLRTERKEDFPPGALGYIRQCLGQMIGIEAAALRQNCGASLYDIARAAHHAHCTSPVFIAWLNRYVHWLEGSPQEEIEGYEFLTCMKTFA